MTTTGAPVPRNSWSAIRKGLRLKCPSCGQGRLLSGYLRPAEACASCNESFEGLRADDGPAWATILLVGHLVSPAFLIFGTQDDRLRWMALALVVTIMLTMTLLILPRMKGLFMAIMWTSRANETVAAATPATDY